VRKQIDVVLQENHYGLFIPTFFSLGLAGGEKFGSGINLIMKPKKRTPAKNCSCSLLCGQMSTR